MNNRYCIVLMATIVLSAIVAPTASADQIEELRACPEAEKIF